MNDYIYSIFLRVNKNQETSAFISMMLMFYIFTSWSLFSILFSPFVGMSPSFIAGSILGVIIYMIKSYVIGYKKIAVVFEMRLTRVYLHYGMIILGMIALMAINIILLAKVY